MISPGKHGIFANRALRFRQDLFRIAQKMIVLNRKRTKAFSPVFAALPKYQEAALKELKLLFDTLRTLMLRFGKSYCSLVCNANGKMFDSMTFQE